jgi:DNA-binding CsgD family transcriptional regulator
VIDQQRTVSVLPAPREWLLGTPEGPGGAFPGRTLDVYHLVAERGELTTGDVAVRLGLSGEQTQTIVAELVSLRLLSETEDGTFIAIPHSQAVHDLLAEEATALARAVDQLSDRRRRLHLVAENRSALDQSEASRISSTTLGRSAERGLFDPSRNASETIEAMHPGGAFSDELLERSLNRAVEDLKRGVRMRVVHQTSALGHPSIVAYLSELAAQGCRVRVRGDLPFRLILSDSTLAICSVPVSGTYSLRGQRVIGLLVRLFGTIWVDSVPLETALSRAGHEAGTAIQNCPARAGAGIGPAHEAILRLLAEGQKDQSIARSLGITTRTVTRRIGEIYELLGVESRFQAGIAAKELGIV